MNQDEIIKLARECDCEETFGMDAFRFTIEQLQAFYRAAYSQGQRDMREAAAKACDDMDFRGRSDEAIWKGAAADDCAEAIRALHIGGQE